MDLAELIESKRVKTWIETLRSRDPIPALVPGGDWNPELTREINDTSHEEVCSGVTNLDDDMAVALKSGFLLWNDALEASHVLSQQIKTSTACYWHGVMHRREPDFGNSKYWFHRVGDHPAFSDLGHKSIEFLQRRGEGYAQTWASEIQVKGWDPFQFVDRCQQTVEGREAPEVVEALEKVQLIEIENLLSWCAHNLSRGSS